MKLAKEHVERRGSGGFTLIEIMVAVGIIAIILAIGIPTLFREAHRDSMRFAVSSLRETFNEARARAVLDGVVTELKFRPGDRTISVIPGSPMANKTGSLALDTSEFSEQRVGSGEQRAGSATTSLKLSDHIIIDFLGVNLVPDLQSMEEVSAFFYPNGTSDEIVLVIRSDLGEVRKITTEVVTGLMDVEVPK